MVLHGDITDTDLAAERVGDFDAVVASTGEDDANVLACLYAKSMGAPETIAVVHRLSLLGLLEQVGIDAARRHGLLAPMAFSDTWGCCGGGDIS